MLLGTGLWSLFISKKQEINPESRRKEEKKKRRIEEEEEEEEEGGRELEDKK